MKMKSTNLWATIALLCCVGFLPAQTATFDRVFEILQDKCASCHGGTAPIAYDLGDTPAETYAAIVGTTPLNPAAAGKGYKRVDPGHPYNSFLLKKVGQNLDGWFQLSQPQEGEYMPAYGGPPPLTSYEAELIRQWILTGAKQTGTQVDTALIWNYYANGGQAFQTPPPAPAPGTGFQVRLGPIFIPKTGSSGNEIELLKKEQLNMPADVEVVRIEGDLNPQSHHFLLFKFDDSTSAAAYDQGLRVVTIFNTATDGDKQLQGAWQYDHNLELPTGTAFYYDKRDVLDLNYHIKNYSATETLPADLYLNIITQPRGTGARPMRAELVSNGGLFLLPGNNSETMDQTWGGDDREIWIISSHTHKYGTDFDIFVRDSLTGNNGAQIYEGFYNRDYTFNQGFYDWEHPAIRTFDTLYTVRASEGLNFETKWTNTSGSIVTFGLTTNDEMQLSTYLYVNKNEVVPVGNTPASLVDPYRFKVYPNPMEDHATLDFGGVRRSGAWTMVDLNGKEVCTGRFKNNAAVNLSQNGLPSGVYMLDITLDNGKALTHKLLVR
jgi:hypothetical protein